MPIVGGGSGAGGVTDHGLLTGLLDDDHPMYILGDGTSRLTGQHIGAGTKPTGGTSDDLSMFGRLYLGTSASEADAYLTNTFLSIKADTPWDAGIANQYPINILVDITGTGAVTAGNIFGVNLRFTGTPTSASGSATLAGLNMAMTPTIPAGVTIAINGILFGCNLSGGGTAATVMGGKFQSVGSATAGSVVTSLTGVEAAVSNLASTCTTLVAFRANNAAGFTISGAVTNAVAFEVGGGFANDTDVVTWSGLRISTGITAAIANKWSLDLTNTSTNMGSRISHKVALGWTPSTVSAITAKVHLAAGTTAAGTAPLKFTSGSLNTTAEAGAVEFLTDDLYLTITTGAARKKIVLDDGTALTSGRIPFATTNGRLTDSSGLTFIASVLSATNIASAGLTSGRVVVAGAAGLLSDDADLTFAGDTLTATKIVASTSIAVAAGAAITELERTASGVYTPTLTNVANLDASTAYQCQWMRVGSTVTVSGKVDVDPTLAATTTQLGISLPIASNFGVEEDCGGTSHAKAIAAQGAAIFGDAANNRAQMEWKSGDVTNQAMYFSFTYRII